MSTGPDNTFNNPNDGNQFSGQQAPPKKSNTWVWVLGVIGVVGLLTVMLCCGGLYFAYQKGTQVLGEQLKPELEGNAVIVEHIGEIESLQMNLTDLVAEVQKHQEENRSGDPPQLLFDIEGTKGSGKVTMNTNPGSGRPTNVVLITEDGERHEIDLGAPDLDIEFEPGDIDMGEIDIPAPVNP